jgi:uncharacterized protein YjbI with pentapeptide repeats
MRKSLGKALPILITVSLFVLFALLVYGVLNENALPTYWGVNSFSKQVIDQNGKVATRELVSPAKTVWDLVDLLLIPFVLAAGGYLFNHSQQKREQEFSEAQNENQRRIGLDRDQEAALQNYLDKMGELLLEKKLNTTKDEVVLNLARSRTLTILRSLNNQYLDIDGRGRNRRKGSLARFLYEMDLIAGENPVINLRKANLEYAYMHGGEFIRANFSGVYLKEADLRNSDLRAALLIDTYLSGARLNDANLRSANLTRANLRKANLAGANLVEAILDEADLEGAIMPDGTVHL